MQFLSLTASIGTMSFTTENNLKNQVYSNALTTEVHKYCEVNLDTFQLR